MDEWTVERHTASASEDVLALYQRFIALIERCGPFTYRVTKTNITLKGARRGFAGAALRAVGEGAYLGR